MNTPKAALADTLLLLRTRLAFGSFLLLAGVLADRYGKKLLFISGTSANHPLLCCAPTG